MQLVLLRMALDLVTDDPNWAGWSQQQLKRTAVRGEFAINDIAYAELSIGYERTEGLDAMMRSAGLVIALLP
jgi:hypothetical protein